jgi:RNA polymerase-binding transcription factor DksA
MVFPDLRRADLNKKNNFEPVTTKKKETKKSAPRGKSPASATSAAILGRPVSKANVTAVDAKKIKGEWQKYYNHLLAKESAQELPGYSLHMADSGTDNFDRDFALSLLSADQDAVYEIEEALKRIERKTYGVCELTGKNIPRARLEAIPWARFTVEAQGQLERDGALRQRRIGALGTVDSVGVTEAETDEDEPEEKPAKEKE